MNEEELMAFIKWLPTKIKEFKGKSPEEIAKVLDTLSKTEEGQLQIKTLVEEFKEVPLNSSIFKKGGKLNYLVEKFKKGGKKTIDTPNGIIYSDEEGKYKDVDGRDAGYKQGVLKEWLAQREADMRFKNQSRVDSTYHTLPGGPIYTRSTFYPYSTDTIVSKDGKIYTNSLGRYIKKFITGTSEFDEINRAIDSIAGYTTKRYQDGGKTNRKDIDMRTIGKQPFWDYLFSPFPSKYSQIGEQMVTYKPYFKDEVRSRVQWPNRSLGYAEQIIKFDSDTGTPIDTIYINKNYTNEFPRASDEVHSKYWGSKERAAAANFFNSFKK